MTVPRLSILSRHFLFALPLLAVFWVSFASAQTQTVPLVFQADKNNVRILPQRFEYSLLDENRIKIGDILIDSATFGFQIANSTTRPGKYRARFIWPYGLVKTGTVLVKDNTGKSIWSVPIRTKEVKVTKGSSEGEANPHLRTQLAEYIVDNIEPAFVEDLKYLTFFNLCVVKATEDTRMNFCSKEFYLNTANNRPTVRTRSKEKKTPYVEINGRSVSNQGIIFLNDETQNVGFRAMSESGATLEIETRLKPVDFKDAVLSEDKKNIVLTASGAEPVAEEKTQRISDSEWRITVDVDRPVLYLKGAGDIPMRQEFYVNGTVPSEGDRPHLTSPVFTRGYREQREFTGTMAANTRVGIPKNKQSSESLEITGKEFRWFINDIPAGETSRHYLEVQPSGSPAGSGPFTVALDVIRQYAYEAELGAGVYLPATQASLLGGLTWWFANFVGSTSDWSRLHWGVAARESFLLNTKSGEANLSITDLQLIWRAEPGFHFEDPTWGLILPVELLQGTGFNTSTFGLGAFYSGRSFWRFKQWAPWQESSITYMLPSPGDIKLATGIKAESVLYRPLDKRWNLWAGAGLWYYGTDPGTTKPQVQIKAGANYRF